MEHGLKEEGVIVEEKISSPLKLQLSEFPCIVHSCPKMQRNWLRLVLLLVLGLAWAWRKSFCQRSQLRLERMALSVLVVGGLVYISYHNVNWANIGPFRRRKVQDPHGKTDLTHECVTVKFKCKNCSKIVYFTYELTLPPNEDFVIKRRYGFKM